MWNKTRISSFDVTKSELKLDDTNHIYNISIEDLVDIYEIELLEKNDKNYKGIEWWFTNWTDDKMSKDKEGNYLDIIYYTKEDKIYWEPFVEMIVKKEVLKNGISEFTMHYIDGNKGHLTNKKVQEDKFSGYNLILKFK